MITAIETVVDSAISFALDEEQEILRQEVRRFAEERIRPGVAERDKSHEFPKEILAKMGRWASSACWSRKSTAAPASTPSPIWWRSSRSPPPARRPR